MDSAVTMGFQPMQRSGSERSAALAASTASRSASARPGFRMAFMRPNGRPIRAGLSWFATPPISIRRWSIRRRGV